MNIQKYYLNFERKQFLELETNSDNLLELALLDLSLFQEDSVLDYERKQTFEPLSGIRL